MSNYDLDDFSSAMGQDNTDRMGVLYRTATVN